MSRSAMPWNSFSSPTGSSRGAMPAPKRSWRPARVRSKLARSRSSLLMKTRRGSPSSAASSHAASVWASTPSTALTTTTTRSTTEQAARTSPKKSAYPGVSIRLILTSPTTMGASDSEIDICRLISSGSKSQTVDPSSTFPALVMAPVANRRASASVVLPAPLCPTRATLRMRDGGKLVTPSTSPRSTAAGVDHRRDAQPNGSAPISSWVNFGPSRPADQGGRVRGRQTARW